MITKIIFTSRDSHDAHYSHDSRIDRNEVCFHFFKNDANNGQNDNSHVQLVPFIFDVATHS